jgi:hypothetical protein
MSVIQLNVAMDASGATLPFAHSIRLPVQWKHWCSKRSMSIAKGQGSAGEMMTSAVLGALDRMEPELRQLDGLITAFRILGEADDSIEPIAVSSLARCAQETLEEIERNWRTAIGAMRALMLKTWRHFRLDFACERSVAVSHKPTRMNRLHQDSRCQANSPPATHAGFCQYRRSMLRRLQPTESTMALTTETSSNETNDTNVTAGGRALAAAEGKAKPGRNGKAGASRAAEAAGNSRRAAKVDNVTKPRARSAIQAAETKTSIVVKKLKSPKGATIDILMEATGWQAHSVRGFLSAVVKKKLGLSLVNDAGKDGVRRYRIDDAAKTSK